MRSPILAAILSLIVAGLGQIYNGQIGKGVIFISLQLINGGLTAVLIGWILLPIAGLFQHRAGAERSNKSAEDWVGRTLSSALPISPEIIVGEVGAHEFNLIKLGIREIIEQQ
jgi:drug/metabolite transporter (DMT)-like permease